MSKEQGLPAAAGCDTSFRLGLLMATMHPNPHTVTRDIQPGAKPNAGLTAPPARATGRG
jgi:hypothetical protein